MAEDQRKARTQVPSRISAVNCIWEDELARRNSDEAFKFNRGYIEIDDCQLKSH